MGLGRQAGRQSRSSALSLQLHRCFRLQVESYRKQGRLESALASTVQWLAALRGRLVELLAEPVSLWVRVKTDAVKHGTEELRLR